jgi:hypothetical protein
MSQNGFSRPIEHNSPLRFFLMHTVTIHELSSGMPDPFALFPNFSIAVYMAAYFSGMDTKSEEHATFVATTMQDSRYSLKDMKGFNAHIENVHLDKYLKDGSHPFQTRDGWQESIVHIRLLVEGMPFDSEDNALMLPIHGLFHQRITDIIKTVCTSKTAETFHFSPYTMHWCPDPLDPEKQEQVYTNTYNSGTELDLQAQDHPVQIHHIQRTQDGRVC